jgi:hypothetical protein
MLTPPAAAGLLPAADLFLPILLLWTPFILFLWDRNYPLLSPEVGVILAIMSLAGYLVGGLVRTAPRFLGALILSGLILCAMALQFEWMATVGKYGVMLESTVALLTMLCIREVATSVLVVFLSTMSGIT